MARLHALVDYRILDTPREVEFDQCAKLIAQLCDTEIGAVTLIDQDRQWVKASYGPLPLTLHRRDAFCSYTILKEGVMEVFDARLDQRFVDSPLVTAEPLVRFYAGIALPARSGLALGTLCVMDPQPRRLTDAQRKALEIAASYLSAQMEVRRSVLQLLDERALAESQRETSRRLSVKERDLTSMLVHDLRGPLASLVANGRFLAEEATLSTPQQEALQDIIRAGDELSGMINDLLHVGRAEDGQLMVLQRAPIDLTAVAQAAIERSRTIAAQSRMRVEFDPGPTTVQVEGDSGLLLRVVSNLLENAYKYAPRGSLVRVELAWDDATVTLRVIDQGAGIDREQRTRIFDKYYRVSEEAAIRPSFGLGLSFCKVAVEAHHGRIEVEDVPQGCSFKVTLPRLGTAVVVAAEVRGPDSPEIDGERSTTDTSLRKERARTDSHFEGQDASVAARADLAVRETRQEADGVLAVARTQEDVRLKNLGAASGTLATVQRERGVADELLVDQRRSADRTLQSERFEDGHEFTELLGAERRETDSDLLLERIRQLKQVTSIEDALEALTARLHIQKQAIDEGGRTRDSFLAMLAHELRTPLTALQLQVQALLREVRGTSGHPATVLLRRLALTERNVQQLETVIARLLDVSELTAPTPTPQTEQVDLDVLLLEIASQMKPVADKAGCELVLDLAPDLEGSWNRRGLVQVLSNLLGNAFKFGAGRPVTLKLSDAGTSVVLEVRDLGIGIDAKDHERIFHRYSRAVSDSHYGGLGVGLWIVQQVVSAMGGTVALTSQLGAGATFTVTLPRR
ncbi:MAG: ATP-binding protein [Myxococcota bacterium]|nr:ATP-binding protein [Myxococcota bacterium]